MGAVETVVVVTAAGPLHPHAVAAVPAGAVVVAADGGLDHALAAGLTPSALVGDLDSVSSAGVAWAEQHATVVRHPADKCATDTELAIAHGVALGAARLVLIAGAGDRLDHTIAAIGALGGPSTSPFAAVEGWCGAHAIHVVRPGPAVRIPAAAGRVFSVLALHGACTGVTITGARWPLSGALLPPLSGLGVSNEIAEPPVTVAVASGVATVIVSPERPTSADAGSAGW